MSLCSECRHFKVPYKYHASAEPCGGWREYHWDRAMCRATADLVTGDGNNHRRCSEERADPNGCGPEARNYEAKPEPPPAPERPARRGLLAWFRGDSHA